MEEKNLFFPLFINLKEKKVLVVGAGKVAYRKTETLLKYGADVFIVTKEIKEEKFKDLKNVKIFIDEFSEKFLEKVFLVVCATDSKETNEKIYKICDEKNILVNNVTSKFDMNCRFGSIINTDEYTIGISARGDCQKAKEFRKKLEKIL